MKYSKLKNEIEVMELQQKHELALLKVKHQQSLHELVSKCNHIYDNGTSAKINKGDQRESWYVCDICNMTIW